MARLREVPRTAAFTWSPGTSSPFLATGTRAGALDADFSNNTELELWGLNLGSKNQGIELGPAASIETDSRFHDIAWVHTKSEQGHGIIAGALENGSLDLWDATKLLSNQSDSLISRTSKHSGAIKTLQFNPFRSELLATAGAKGELYISDLNNVGSPYRLGNTVGRADEFECLDWNQKVAHIMVTGSSSGFVTVWDVKTKKESLTLNNLGRKPVSAVVWDPEKPTRLITSVPLDTDPLILVWDLRNSNAPEKVLRGHDGGVLSLSWCHQDSDLLLSCGKDNRTICWNPQSGESYGELPVVTNWTFQTRWNPHHPNIFATASFDGKIAVHTIQNTQAELHQGSQAAPLDGEDFFAKASSQPQSSSFSLMKPPKWLQRPSAVSFGFGGKLVTVKYTNSETRNSQSVVSISRFSVDDGISLSAEAFFEDMELKGLSELCRDRISKTSDASEKHDWETIEALLSSNPRKELINALGFQTAVNNNSDEPKVSMQRDAEDVAAKATDGDESQNSSRLSSFFDKNTEGDNFLADLASTKGAKTNNPFQIFSDSEPSTDKQITYALMLGQFDKAMEICLAEERLTDAFMIAVCGGQSSIEKVQQAYLRRQASGPKYLRLLASVVGKNLWDIVYNADLKGWKEVMATLCTYANSDEFSDLCESLGDRLEEELRRDPLNEELRRSASFCYIAGSRLEKVVGLWIADLEKSQKEELNRSEKDTSFSVHVRVLQRFIEKVTIFRGVTKYEDVEFSSKSGWKLVPLYDKYSEYAEIVAAQGQLNIASKYLDLLPTSYPSANLSRNRVLEATRTTPSQGVAQRNTRPANSTHPRAHLATSGSPHHPSAAPIASTNPYAPPQSYYSPTDITLNNSTYQTSQQQSIGPGPMIPPPPSVGGRPLSAQANPTGLPPNPPPPSKAQNMPNWNDTPEDFFKPPTSRRGTPGASAAPASSPFQSGGPNVNNSPYGVQQYRQNQPAPPPPKGPAPPLRSATPSSMQVPERPPSAATSTYAPSMVSQPAHVSPVQAQVPRGPSPYNAPPMAGIPPAGSRYAPAPAPPAQQPNIPQRSQPPPNPYTSRPSAHPAAGPPPRVTGPPTGPPQSSISSPPPAAISRPAAPRHPPGDRSHIPSTAFPIYEILSEDMQRVKAKAPASYKAPVEDTEKRLGLLFDNLNNETLLKPNTIQDMVELANAIKERNYDKAQTIHVDILTNRTDECGQWMTGVKRLIGMSKATP